MWNIQCKGRRNLLQPISFNEPFSDHAQFQLTVKKGPRAKVVFDGNAVHTETIEVKGQIEGKKGTFYDHHELSLTGNGKTVSLIMNYTPGSVEPTVKHAGAGRIASGKERN